MFKEITKDTWLLYAQQNYDNPTFTKEQEFLDDLKRFKYIKRLMKKYVVSGELKHHLILNHMIICFNVFGEGAIPLFFYKIDKEYWTLIKTFLQFLNRIPDFPKTGLDSIQTHKEAYVILNSI